MGGTLARRYDAVQGASRVPIWSQQDSWRSLMAGLGDSGWFEEAFKAASEKSARDIGRFNMALFGKTGVGKSTLVNAIFGEYLAATGIGEPVTRSSQMYMHKSGVLGVLDTVGLEIGKDSETILSD